MPFFWRYLVKADFQLEGEGAVSPKVYTTGTAKTSTESV